MSAGQVGDSHTLVVVAAVAVAAAITAGGSATASARVHGGAGLVRTDGAGGKLHLDRATAVDVKRFCGAGRLPRRWRVPKRVTVYFINERTDRLALFTSRAP